MASLACSSVENLSKTSQRRCVECRGKAPLVHTSVGKLVELWTDGVQVSQNKRSTAVQPMADVTSRQWLQNEGTLVGAVKHVDTTGMCTNRSPRPLRVAKYTARIMTVQIITVTADISIGTRDAQLCKQHAHHNT